MPLVRLITDPFDLASYTEHQADDLFATLAEHLPVWPETARLYRGSVAVCNDVTPRTETDVNILRGQDDVFYVVVYPGDPVTAVIAVVATLVLTAAVLLFLTPRIPTAPNLSQNQSSNNSLGGRVNKARPAGRIPEIFGEVVSIPELLTVPLLVFDNNLEVEYCYMAIGRGDYYITDVKDGDTPLNQIAGSGAEFYGPGTSPGSGAPFYSIGADIDQALLNVVKLNEVNGQTLRPPNSNSVNGNANVRFVSPDTIQSNGGTNFTENFAAGDALTVAGTGRYGLDGTYNVLAVTDDSITLSDPEAVNPKWGDLETAPTDYISPRLYTTGVSWVGPFVVDLGSLTQVVANFFAPQGLYRITKDGAELTQTVDVALELTPIGDDDLPTGPAELFSTTLSGNPSDKSQKGVTLYATPTFTGRCQARARRTSNHDLGRDNDTVVDDVKWRDCFGTAPPGTNNFGNVTTVHTRTYATASALSVKDRKLNCRAARKVAVRNPDNTFGPALAPSTSAADIICHMALDKYIGGRTLAELDVAQIYDTLADVAEYFGFADVATFSYTFDQDNISFEEMAQSVAQAVFCTAYRQGSLLRLLFERQTDDATLLFNHRNKLPGSETRTVRFGTLNDYDGVELDYISGKDGAKLTLYVPSDRSAATPKKIDLTGVVDRRGDTAHPTLHAMRAYNKIKYQHTTTEFTALAEASQLVVNERVDISDNTRADIRDGEVRAVQGLTLTLSQPAGVPAGQTHTLFLQLPSGKVESISCTPGPAIEQVVLARAPSEALSVADDQWALPTYQITAPTDARPNGFLISEKGPCDNLTVSVQAINYDPRYYQNDADYS